jgi:hypothetical protein
MPNGEFITTMANFRLRARSGLTVRLVLFVQLLVAAGFVVWWHGGNDGGPVLEIDRLGKATAGARQPPMLPPGGHLRFDWTDVPVLSPMAQSWRNNQQRCDWPLADFQFRNLYGMGSDVHTWTQALCNAAERRVRMRTKVPWTFLDESSCFGSDGASAPRSAMDCYFPMAEPACPTDSDVDRGGSRASSNQPKLYHDTKVVEKDCASVMSMHNLSYSDVRASAIEYLFSHVSPLVVREAERQLEALFGDGNKSRPSRLITVHVRWGDKNTQIDPIPIREYVKAVNELISSTVNDKGNSDRYDHAHKDSSESIGIYLSTEDPLAVEQFQQEAAKYNWKVFVDMYYQEFSAHRLAGYNGNPKMAKKLQGRPGLVALASLLVALQSDDFVLTTISNWSRLINELRKTVIDPRCNDCTRMIDLTNFTFEW